MPMEDVMLYISRQKIYWNIVACIIVLVVIVLITIGLVVSSWQKHSQSVFDLTIEVDEKIHSEYQVLRDLNALYFDRNCSENQLDTMRWLEFKLDVVRNIGYIVDDYIICNTVSGSLLNPVEIDERGFSSPGSDILFKINAMIPGVIEGGVSSRVIIGNFLALLRLPNSIADTLPWIHAGVFVPGPELQLSPVLEYVKFTPRYPPYDQGDKDYWLEDGHWIAQYCYRNNQCAISAVDILGYIKYHQNLLWLLPIFTGISLLFSVMLSSILHGRYMRLDMQLKRGLTEDRIECHYQPIFNIKGNKIEGCEVLCRWYDENRTLVRPDFFIGQIEANGQTRILTEIVFKKAIRELKEAGLFGVIRVSVNMFPDDISSGHIEHLMGTHLLAQDASCITFELTEQELLDVSPVIKGIDLIRKKSARVAIDDFGTGYSNFQHLEALSVDCLKIDKSFVQNIENNSLRSELVKYMVDMASTLGLYTVAEGVEKEEQLELLKCLGVTYSQGYLHSRPIPIEEFNKYVNSQLSIKG